MSHAQEVDNVSALIELLGEIQVYHERLFALIEEKIHAMRRADTAAMNGINDQEHTLVKTLTACEPSRRRLLDDIGRTLGMTPSECAALTVSRLAPRLPEPQGQELMVAAHNLREAMVRVAQANRVAGAIAREIVHHMQWVFAAVRPAGVRPAGYSHRGAPLSGADAAIIDAVG